ncbi:MAG: hypothetical protein LBJ58_05210 [Tannerellaceae bacterium]|jgi:hypothetical protein|nr:hypothetical protein [Tannerellaceae bacterium]
MSNSQWLPKGHRGLYEKVYGIVTYVDKNDVNFGMDKDARFGNWYQKEFRDCFNKYLPLYNAYEDDRTRTPYIVTELKTIEKQLLPLVRDLYLMLSGNKLVSDADLAVMHLPARRNGGHRPAPVAALPPKMIITPLESNRLRISYFPEGTEHKSGKPYGQHGVEIKWGFSDETVLNQDQLPYSIFDTASPYTLKFTLRDAGKAVDIALRWENTRGEKGPWSRIARAIVP